MEQQENVVVKTRKKKRWSIIAVICVVVLIFSVVFLIKKPKEEKKTYSYIRTTTLKKGSLEDSISTTGTVESAQKSNVTTDMNYTISTVNVAVGDTVKKGDVICTLDTTDLEKQIDREKENLSKTKESAQSSYDMAKESYDKAKENVSEASEKMTKKMEEKVAAYDPYQIAANAIQAYQSDYDSALSDYEKAGAKYVAQLKKYNNAVSKYKKDKITVDKLITVAKRYMESVQNYYGGLAIGNYNISDSDSGQGNENSFGGSSLISVTETAEMICDAVVSQVSTLTGKTISYGTGNNTLSKLSKKAADLRDAKLKCNYDSLAMAYETAEANYEAAKETFAQREESLSQAENQLEQAKEQLSEASSSETLEELQSQLEECELKANQDGTVTSLNATVGSVVNTMNEVATISSLDNLKISVTIAEADINQAEIGMSCYITSDASDETLNGTLTQLNPVANDSGSFNAEVRVDSVTDKLHIGMNASVEIIVSSTDNVYQVPIDAVDTDDSGDFIYKKTGGEGVDMTFEKVYVTTGEKNDYYIEVYADELQEGDVIRSTADLTAGIESREKSTEFAFPGGNQIPSGDFMDGMPPNGERPSGGFDAGERPSGGDKQNFPGGGVN